MPEDIFSKITVFNDLRPSHNRSLRSVFYVVRESAGMMLFDQGEPARNLYLVVEGEVHIRYKPDDGAEILVARVGPQGAVGWSAALGNPTYTSSAVCATECKLLRASREDLCKLCERDPQCAEVVLLRLAEVIAKRLRNTHQHVLELLKEGLRNHSAVRISVSERQKAEA